MLHLRRRILARLVSPPAAPPISHLHRQLSTASSAVSPSPGFNVEEYLVERCGLTQAQALKATAKLSHIKSPSKPDAVLAFLAGLGHSRADVAAVVAKDPVFLCARVEKTLAPNVSALTGLGLSSSEVASLVSLAPDKFRTRFVSKLQYYLHIFGSIENLLRAFKVSTKLLTGSLEKVVKPNVVFLRECGIGDCDIAKPNLSLARMLTTKPESVWATVACVEGLGVPCGSGMFRQALRAVALLSGEEIAVQVKCLKNTFGWSDAEVGAAVCKFPAMMGMSKDNLQSKSELFLISEVGLEPTYIVHRPVIIGYSLDGRLRPRYYVLKFLKENGFLDHGRDYYAAVMMAEKVFLDKYIHPHKEFAPHLAQDYADACRGEVPARFKLA